MVQSGSDFPDRHLSNRPGQQRTLQDVINERRLRTDIPYVFPNAFTEEDYQNFPHYTLRHFLKGNYIAPLTDIFVRDILDLGSGNGIWMADMAREFPMARIVGMDITIPGQPAQTQPANCLFIQGNVLRGLPFQDQAFDFVHQRQLAAAIPAANWLRLVQELARITRPGGFVELIETADMFINEGPNTRRLMGWWREAWRQTGFDIQITRNLHALLRQASLVNIMYDALPVPLGKWAGLVGEAMSGEMHAFFSSFEKVCIRMGIVSEKMYWKTWEALPLEWEHHKSSLVFFLAYGQKQFAQETDSI